MGGLVVALFGLLVVVFVKASRSRSGTTEVEMRIDDRTAILIYRRINTVALGLINGRLGEHPERERRIVRVMRWIGSLAYPLTPWILDPEMTLPDPGPREWRRGGVL